MLTNDFLPMIGGVAIHIDSLASALTNLGNEVIVVHVCYGNVELETETLNGYKVIRVSAGNNLENKSSIYAKIMRYLMSLTVVRQKLKKIIVTFSPDIIHLHDYYHSSLSTKLLRRNNISLVLTNHASRFLEQYEKGALMHFYLKTLAAHVDGVIGPSQELTEKSKLIGKPTKFIPNGVDEKIFYPTRKHRKLLLKRLGIPPNFKVILAPRRLDPKNGLDILIQSIPEVIKSYPNTMVVIAGGGKKSLKSEYETLAENLGVANNLIMTGIWPRQEMQQLIPSSDLVVIPSFYEAVSLAALEALSCGIPVIASNVGGLPFIISKSNGALFNPGDHHELAQIIKNHLKYWPATLKKGKEARATIKREHSWKNVAIKTTDFYNQLF